MKIRIIVFCAIALLGIGASHAQAQTQIISITLNPNQIGVIKTTQSMTTRVAFGEPVRDIICGDLYDAASGKGAFVVQRIDNDVFIKPVAAKGISNLFVKTGEKGEHTYGFDLLIAAPDQAHRIVNVANAATPAENGAAKSDATEKLVSAAQKQSEEVLSNARTQAENVLAQANQRAAELYSQAIKRTEELDRQAADRAGEQVEERFLRAVIQGVREIKTSNSQLAAHRILVSLDPRVLTFDEKSYLRYSIKNNDDKEFAFGALALEKTTGKESSAVPARVVQGRKENRLKPGETIIGVIVFDAKAVAVEDRLTLHLRSEDNTEFARLTIQ
jgi:type IV secretory pathway VirB9-like protein